MINENTIIRFSVHWFDLKTTCTTPCLKKNSRSNKNESSQRTSYHTRSVRLTKSNRSHVPITRHPNMNKAERHPNRTDACFRRTSSTGGIGSSSCSPLNGYNKNRNDIEAMSRTMNLPKLWQEHRHYWFRLIVLYHRVYSHCSVKHRPSFLNFERNWRKRLSRR